MLKESLPNANGGPGASDGAQGGPPVGYPGGPPGGPTGHVDRFVLDHLPPEDLRPHFDFSAVPSLQAYPNRFNIADLLLSGALAAGHGDRLAVICGETCWTYQELAAKVDQIAAVLVEDLDLQPGNRVLLRAPNVAMLVACWLAVAKAGGICAATVPMLRPQELAHVIDKARISHALCLQGLEDDLLLARRETTWLRHVVCFTASGEATSGEDDAALDRAMTGKTSGFKAADTAADDPVMIGFTSGTTGQPKAAVHFHRSVLAITDCFPRDINPTDASAVIAGSPPIPFTFGMGVFIAIPLRYGATSVLTPKPSPEGLLHAIQDHRVSDLYAVPTMYRALLTALSGSRIAGAEEYDLSSLKRCMSAGEKLPADTAQRWRAATGLDIHDGIGSTEMLHHFLATPAGEFRAGVTGRAIAGFSAKVIDQGGAPVALGEIGRLAVQGPTGCLYLADEDRQRSYVEDGWNITGDLFRADAGGWFSYVSRADDMIISSGYNISGIEVEDALLRHPWVAECAVVAMPDDVRGQLVKAFVVLTAEAPDGNGAVRQDLANFVKAEIAPYKYPRALEFVAELPKTVTGKIQRYQLRKQG